MSYPTVSEWAPHKGMNPFAWLWFVFRSTWLFFVVDNPLSWKLGVRGGVNQFDDIEGKFAVSDPDSCRDRWRTDPHTGTTQGRSSSKAHPHAR